MAPAFSAPASTDRRHLAHENVLTAIAESPHLPTPPAVALQIIQKASEPDCELEEIGQIIALDPGLCGQVLRCVNSAMFGLQRSVGLIDRALNYLGLKSVRSLVLTLSLPTMRIQTSSDERLRDFWKASVTGAIVARELAVRLGRADSEDDMVAALLCDLGVFVLQQVFPVEYAPVIAEPADVLAFKQCELEEQALGINHADVSAFILERWRLPEEMTQAIRHHHRPADAQTKGRTVAERSRLLYLATRIAQMQNTPNAHPELLREILTLACDGFRMSETEFLALLPGLNQKIDEFVAILQMDVGTVASYPTLVANATLELIHLTMENNAEAVKMRAEKEVADQEVTRWRRIAHSLRREATRDRLTGAYNRSYYDEALAHEFHRARRRCTVLGLLFLDLDGFKEMNDRHGRPLGDQMLKETASVLRRESRPDDVVARFGGDEFCVILPDTSIAGAELLANRMLCAIEAVRIKHEGETLRFSASVGAAICIPHRSRLSAQEFQATADRAMGEAKASGKNRLNVLSLVTEADTTFLEEVRARLFRTYLLGREIVTEEQIKQALRAAPSTSVMLGRLARRLGWLTPRRLRKVLRDQHRQRRRFGESAVALGYLTQQRVYTLLALRREPPEDLAEGLIDVRAMTLEEAQNEVSAYYQIIVASGAASARR